MLKGYGDDVHEISSLIDKAILRLNALIDPTSENKLKVLSIPSMEELSRKMSDGMNQLHKRKEEIAKHLQNINKVLEDGKIKCDDCNGEGKVKQLKYQREDDIVTPFYEYEKCPTCGGLGYFTISEEVRRRGYETMKAMKMIVTK
jgi:DnaJ-class molecular chaperone